MIFVHLAIFLIFATNVVNLSELQCEPSITTVSGTKAPTNKLCSGQLILNENFDTFDRDLWEHEVTLGGGGVSSFIKISQETLALTEEILQKKYLR